MKTPLHHLIVASAVCASSVVGYGVWYAAISAKSTAVADLQNKIDTKTETVSRIAATRATLAEVASDEGVVRNYFVPEANVVAFIDSLESRGRTLGATVGVTSVSKGGTAAQPVLAFALTVSGTFDAVMRTVGAIEFAPYGLSLSSLSVAQDDKDRWRADFKLTVGSVPAARAATSTPQAPVTALVAIPSPYAYF